MDNATFFCVLSLICMYGSGILLAILTIISKNFSSLEFITNILSGIVGLAPIAAWVLVIYARVHYKESTFPKVLLIIYIIQLVISIIFFIFAVLLCIYEFNDCVHSFRNCGDIGALMYLLWL